MGSSHPEVIDPRRRPAERSQGLTVVHAIMVAVILLILLQFLLLMVALEDFLSGSRTLLWGAAAGSGGCFGAACWLIRYIVARRSA